MTERTSSHKSDGRQSSAGQSTHSARANSFGFEPRSLSAAVPPFVPLGPPPGLFILGPVPSIIRCWLDTKFSNESLLYAAVCTGAFRSVIDSCLASRLGFDEHIKSHQGERLLKIPVYLPEATIQQPSSRANSPAPQLPLLTVEFSVQSFPTDSEAIQIFLGCDVLRARNADIHFSLDRMTLFDDERNKLSIPLVRPENATAFQSLRTTNFDLSGLNKSIEEDQSRIVNDMNPPTGQALNSKVDSTNQMQEQFPEQLKPPPMSMTDSAPISSSPSIIGEGRKSLGDRENGDNSTSVKSTMENRDLESFTNGNPPETPTRFESGNIWGSWRRDSTQNGRLDLNPSNPTSTSGYQRPGRGRGMKVLKPARLNTSRSTSAGQTPVGFDAAPARLGEAGRGVGLATNDVQFSASPATDARSSSSDAKTPLQPLSNKPRSANPVGGASAFGWLNSSEQKQSPIPSE
ncbi:hypothetical protein MMC07_007685 [Pseudocyphellaria aurata]|nr:hypothetical protein [Pseudocyphellaria aurata]